MKPKTIHATSVVIEDSGVLIVGNSGLGKSDLALRLIDSGATLISDDITICKKVDVRDRDALVAAVREAEETYGPTDMMFNNAGVARLADISTQDPNEWDEMIDVNTKGVMNGIYAVMSDMKARKSGTIVNMSSIAGRKVYEDHTVYCGTKYFVHAISESIRGYLSPHNVRVIVFSPGNIEAEVLNGITDPNTLAAFIALSSSLQSMKTYFPSSIIFGSSKSLVCSGCHENT